MAKQRKFLGRTGFGRTSFGRVKSIAGAILLGVGVLVLQGNLDRSATRLSHFFCTVPRDVVSGLPAVILTVSEVVRAYTACHGQFVQEFLLQALATAWPLLLIVVGAVLSREEFMENLEGISKKDRGRVDRSCGCSTLE